MEACFIELDCGPIPEGHSRWIIHLLDEKSSIVLDTQVSREIIRHALIKSNVVLIIATTDVSQQRKPRSS